MLEAIRNDFSEFRGPFSQEKIDLCIEALKKRQGCEKAGLVRILFADGRGSSFPLFTLTPGQEVLLEKILSALSTLHERVPLPRLDFLLCLAPSFDRPLLLFAASVPVFAMSKEKHNQKAILIPRFEDPDRELLFDKLTCPWHLKIEKAFWRGSMTDGPYGFFDWDFNTRARIVLLSTHHRDLLDAALLPSSNDYLSKWLDKLSMLSSFAPPEKQALYKYMISLDGRRAPSSFEWQLFTGSLIFKTSSTQREWFYPALKPGRHYVPIHPTGVDLVEKILWFKERDFEAQLIAEEAVQFANANLKDEELFLYFYYVILEYIAYSSSATNRSSTLPAS